MRHIARSGPHSPGRLTRSTTSFDHGWLTTFLEHRIGDQRVLRLIQKWLSAGVIEEGNWSETTAGVPQGASVSPLLANVYLHYVFDQWVHQWRRRRAHGDVIVVRFVDDFVVGFEHRGDAERFLEELRTRLARFALELHPEKTRLIEFGRFAAGNRKAQGLGKPETFDFLGFTHVCAKTKAGWFQLRRITMRKRVRMKLHQVKTALQRNRHLPVPRQGHWLRSVLLGHYAYYGVPGNARALNSFRYHVAVHWTAALRRRSQRHRLSWARMVRLVERWLPAPRIMHPYPDVRFAATTRGMSPVR